MVLKMNKPKSHYYTRQVEGANGKLWHVIQVYHIHQGSIHADGHARYYVLTTEELTYTPDGTFISAGEIKNKQYISKHPEVFTLNLADWEKNVGELIPITITIT